MNRTIEHKNGLWTIIGEGPMRPIIVESDSYDGAEDAWDVVYGRQYEEQERHTHQALEERQ